MDKHDVCAVHRVSSDRKITVGGRMRCILSAVSWVGRINIKERGGGTPGFSLTFGPDEIARPPDQLPSQPLLFEST